MKKKPIKQTINTKRIIKSIFIPMKNETTVKQTIIQNSKNSISGKLLK